MGEVDPNGISAGSAGSKLDAGKPKVVRGALHYFPRALEEVAKVSEFGASKYLWNGWESVPDGVSRYAEAGTRHVLKEKIEGDIDSDSGLYHKAHKAWNALAELELFLREEEAKSSPEKVTDERRTGNTGYSYAQRLREQSKSVRRDKDVADLRDEAVRGVCTCKAGPSPVLQRGAEDKSSGLWA